MPDIHPNLMLSTLREAIRRIRDPEAQRAMTARAGELRDVEFAWQNGDQCHMPGCTKPAITASHTVQKAAMAQQFGGTTCRTPKWSGSRFTVRPAPIAAVSTFPGYCDDHEKKFPFESAGKFLTPDDDRLQIMRTVHRELWLTERRREFADRLLVALVDVTAVLLREGTTPASTTDVLQSRTRRLDEWIARQGEMLVRLRPLADLLASPRPRSTSVVRAADVPDQPFVFHAAVTLDDPSAALLAIALVYNGARSRLITAIEPGFEHVLASYWARFASSDPVVHATLTRWMQEGTIDWYASPAWWDGLPPAEKTRVEELVNTGF